MHIWLNVDPDPNSRGVPRINVQTRPFTEYDYPPGHGPHTGEDWPEVRELDVPDQTWTKMLRGTFSPEAQDAIHARWWDDAAPDDEPWDRMKSRLTRPR